MDLMTVMGMTDEEVWLSQFDERDLEASQILLQLHTRPMPPPERKRPTPEPMPRPQRMPTPMPMPERTPTPERRQRMPDPEPEPFLVVWGRKKLLRGKTMRDSGSPSTALASFCQSSRFQSASPTTPLTNGQPSSESEDSATHQPTNERRKQVAESAEEKKKSQKEIKNCSEFGQLYLQQQSPSLCPSGPKSMGLLRIQPNQEVAKYGSLEKKARAREARRLRKMKIQQARQRLQ